MFVWRTRRPCQWRGCVGCVPTASACAGVWPADLHGIVHQLARLFVADFVSTGVSKSRRRISTCSIAVYQKLAGAAVVIFVLMLRRIRSATVRTQRYSSTNK